MSPQTSHEPAALSRERDRRVSTCRSCGKRLADRRRKYCAPSCRSQLQAQLGFSRGLLRALGTRLAAFHWTEQRLILQVWPKASQRVYGFLFPRRAGRRPAADFVPLVFALSEQWWAVHDSTASRCSAAHSVLRGAAHQHTPEMFTEDLGAAAEVRPVGLSAASLITLDVSAQDLLSESAAQRLAEAYRRQAVATHPDAGGTDEQFIRLKEAFDELRHWIHNPRVRTTRRGGLWGKWLYDGARGTWHPPRG
jgi:hypothetical protein